MTAMRALVVTNQFSDWTGSEVVALEIAEEFARRKWQASVLANAVSDPLRSTALANEIQIFDDPSKVSIADYSVIWSQHWVLPMCHGWEQLIHKDIQRVPVFAYAHLSPFEPLEMPCGDIEGLLADHVLANSAETKGRLLEIGFAERRIRVFHNASPQRFFVRVKDHNSSLGRLLVVSNHPPTELLQALDMLRARGIDVTVVGQGQNYRRILPSDIANHDAVVTIGKTAIYAILGKTPVFVYDQFGGPGWLTETNWKEQEDHNFSGRPGRRRVDPEKLVIEIVDGYAAATEVASSPPVKSMSPFLLDRLIDRLIESAHGKKKKRGAIRPQTLKRLDMERIVAQKARKDFIAISQATSAQSQSTATGETRSLLMGVSSPVPYRNEIADAHHVTPMIGSMIEALAQLSERLVGRSIELNAQLAERDNKISWLNQAVADRDGQVVARLKENLQLEADKQSLKSELTVHEKRISSFEVSRELLVQQVVADNEAKQERISGFLQTVAAQAAELSDLREKDTSVMQRLTALSTELEKVTAAKAAMATERDEISAWAQKLERAKGQLVNEHDIVVADKNAELAKLKDELAAVASAAEVEARRILDMEAQANAREASTSKQREIIDKLEGELANAMNRIRVANELLEQKQHEIQLCTASQEKLSEQVATLEEELRQARDEVLKLNRAIAERMQTFV